MVICTFFNFNTFGDSKFKYFDDLPCELHILLNFMIIGELH